MRDEKDICMFCDEEIEEGDKVECKKCKSVYHKTCFDELQHLCMKCGEDNDLNEKEVNLNGAKNLIYEFLNDLCIITEIERVVSKFNYKNEFYWYKTCKKEEKVHKSIKFLTQI